VVRLSEGWAKQNVGGSEIRLQQLRPRGQPFGKGWKQIRDDMFVRVVIRVHFTGELDMPRVDHTFDGKCLLLRFAQRWQEHAGQDRDNGDDHQEFD
jgi:hypothetical protein